MCHPKGLDWNETRKGLVFETFTGLDWDLYGDKTRPCKGLEWNKTRKGLESETHKVLIETFTVTKQDPVKVSNETRPLKVLNLRRWKSRLRPLRWQNKTP